MPKPRPHAAAASAPLTITGTVPSRSAPAAMAQAAPAPATNPFASVLGRTTNPGGLTPQQRSIIDRISNYLSSIQVLTGQFVQVGPDGRRSEGQLYIQKPGKMRFEYDPPSPIEIVSDGGSVVVRDRNLATQDVYPLSQTPLRFLLADRLDLLKDTHLVAVYADEVFITVVVEETHGVVGKSRMMIMFGAKDTQLKQWTVTDPQGFDTTVAVYNLDFTKRPDPSLFQVDYTRYKN
ncbi:MAG: outer-membrane lipoprotein carrier protein LolA [Pseudolabrys sp.]